MTSAEFKTVRESLGLTAQWIAEHCPNRDGGRGVQLRSVQYWEAGRTAVPADVADWLVGIEAGISQAVAQALAVVAKAPPVGFVALVRYRTDADLWQFRQDFRPLPAACHAMLLGRLRAALAEREVLSRIVFMEPDQYVTWLAGRTDTEAMRAAWAAQQ